MLKNSVLAMVAIFLGAQLAASAQDAKNAILFIGDGMGLAQVTAARIFQKNARDGQLTLDTLPHTALVRTYSSDRAVTDSAAAGTAMASGFKTGIGRVGQTDDDVARETILEAAKAAGKSVGIVTTTGVTHATPACFYAHVKSRGRETEIAEQLVDGAWVDVVLGGGREFFMPREMTDPESGDTGKRRDERDLLAEAREKGYEIVMKQEEFDALAEKVDRGEFSGKVMGLFSDGTLSYEVSRENDKWGEPSLAELTELAIDLLSKNPNGYVLMVEGGKIDHASHSSQPHLMVTELLAFDQAIAKALELTGSNNDTMLVVTADHETGGLTVNGYPPIELGGVDLFTEPSGPSGDYILMYSTGPGADRAKAAELPRDDPSHRVPALHFTSSASHTGVDVIAWGAGPGAERVHGTLDNTQIAHILRDALGLPPVAQTGGD